MGISRRHCHFQYLAVSLLVLLVSTGDASSWTSSSNSLSNLHHLQPHTSSQEPPSISDDVSTTSNIAKRSLHDRVLLCDENLREMIVTQAKVIKSMIDDFKETYVQAKFSASWEILDYVFDSSQDQQYLKVCDQTQCAQVLPTLPMGTPPHPTKSWSTDHLPEASCYIRQYTIALELLFLDQSLNEDEFQKEIDELHRLMELLATLVMEGLESCEVESDDSVLGHLAGKVYTRTDNVITDHRGFRTLRQCLFGLQYIIDLFSG
ncbi:uncharacterized protein [Panulirus ornatus]|uniref:uncharacterized protein n=1 Tax=Panulirus ornatus TaxID=150431 RepID=UPI003A86773F